MENKNYQDTRVLTDVRDSGDYFELSSEGICCGLNKKYGVTPKVGDRLTVHTKGGSFGIIRGMDLNGEPIFYKTDEQLESERLAELQKMEEDKQQKFKENVSKMDEQYTALPECFRTRIDKFRYHNPRFRVDFESYELFTCEEAVKIANACKTPEQVEVFRKMKSDAQRKLVPSLSDGHSGNTFGCATVLAYWYLKEPENVVKYHGAMVPLVGCEEYGCHHE